MYGGIRYFVCYTTVVTAFVNFTSKAALIIDHLNLYQLLHDFPIRKWGPSGLNGLTAIWSGLEPVDQTAQTIKNTAEVCVLDLATGNGIGARALRARVGGGSASRVVATDGCKELLKFAQERQEKDTAWNGESDKAAIEYLHLDLMNRKQLEEFTEKHT